MTICVSIVSHGHGGMVDGLVRQVLACPEVDQLILTLNIQEPYLHAVEDKRVIKIGNQSPKGFGANHNAAFQICNSQSFCVLNPDVELTGNPFPVLLADLEQDRIGLCAPLVVGSHGQVDDSARRFMTPWRMVLRKLGLASGTYTLEVGAKPIYPEWVAGMFMLFKTSVYRQVGGFDEAYFMYCEDADICTRLWRHGEKVLLDPAVSVIHQAQRASRRRWLHLRWHLASMIRYFARYCGRLPRASGSL